MKNLVRESILWAFIALPYVYLATIWNKLPDRVPMHFNIEGTADAWSGKATLLFLPGALGVGIYLLMLVIPLLDPKKKIRQMGDKYYAFRFMLTFFFSLLSMYILYVTNEGSLENPNVLVALIGALFAMLGNYFPTVRPNYFIGIRTPWTLENEGVWKKTHRIAGRLWVVGGLLIVILSFVVQDNTALALIFGSILFIMVIIPVVFSYLDFKKETRVNGAEKNNA